MFIEELNQSDIIEFLYSLVGRQNDGTSNIFDYSKVYNYTNENGKIVFYTKYDKHAFSDFKYVHYFIRSNEQRKVIENQKWQQFLTKKFGQRYTCALDNKNSVQQTEL